MACVSVNVHKARNLLAPIQAAPSGAELDFVQGTTPKTHRIPLRYQLLLNSNLSDESRYATLVHELGHLYCGHLGAWDQRSWPDRRGVPVAVREFEAESVSYLVCSRLGIENASK